MRRAIFGVTAILFISTAASFSQGTAFTYQGRLNNGTNSASGAYDLRFALFDAPNGGSQQGVTVTNSATTVNNGLFTATLDFGNQFPGTNRWLEISVRTNGSGAFATLTPRQQITSTPYAVQSANAASAASAGSVAAVNILGTLTTAQLPGSVVTNGASGVNIAGNFTGNGAGLTNVPGTLPVQVISGTGLQAQPNRSYDATNVQPVTATLPTNANIGDIVQVNGLGSGGWQVAATNGQVINGFDAGFYWTAVSGLPVAAYYSMACSSNGLQLITGTYTSSLLTSPDGGGTWASQPGPFLSYNSGQALACSADGNNVVVAPNNSQIYTSTNGGVNWTARANFQQWQSVASSYDGTKLVAVDIGEVNSEQAPPFGRIYTSANSGVTWIPQSYSNVWTSVASSADGSKLVATALNDVIYTSINGGASWTPQAGSGSGQWQCVASSADGNRLVAAQKGGLVYTSANGGATWTARLFAAQWQSVACSADGTRIIAAVGGFSAGPIYVSYDSGATWRQAYAPAARWECVRLSADGTRMFATYDGGANTGGIFSSLPTSLAGGQGASVTLQYAGNGVWQALNVSSQTNVPNSAVVRDSAGKINTAGITISGNNTLEFGYGVAGKEFNAGKIGYQTFSPDSLDIVGAGTGANRKIRFWSEAGSAFVGPIFGNGGGLSNLNSAGLTGSISDSLLSPTVARRNVANAFTGNQTVTGGNVGIGTATPGQQLQVGDFNNPTDGLIRLACGFGNNSGIGRVWDIGVPYGGIDSSGTNYCFVITDPIASVARFLIDWRNGNIGIGTSLPNSPLTFGQALGDKISLWTDDDHINSYGFGIQGSQLQIHTDTPAADIVFGGGNSTNMTETMRIKGSGNVGIGTTNPATKLDVAGEVTMLACNITSDRNAKEQFKPVNSRELLNKVAQLPISEWQYKTQTDARHIGPMAQDFREAFGLGRDDKHITSIDADGVALAAIQGLNQKVEELTRDKDERIRQLENEIGQLKEMLARLPAEKPTAP